MPEATVRRDGVRRVAHRVSRVTELLLVALGAWQMWAASRAGHSPSRPALIAFWAGLVGLALSFLVPRVRAVVRARAEHRRGSTTAP